MNKKNILINLLILSICILVFIQSISNPLFFDNTIDTLYIWLYNVFPPVFNFYIIINLLLYFNILYKILIIFKPLNKIFKFDTDKGLYLYITSILLGNPSSTAILKNELYNNEISYNDYNKIMKCSSFPSLLFILSLYNNFKNKLIILLSMIISSIVICILLSKNKRNDTVSIMKTNNEVKPKERKNITTIFVDAIKISLTIASIMCFSSSIIFSFDYIKIPNIITTLLELCNGIFIIKKANLSLIIELAIVSFLLSFNCFSIHLQIYTNKVSLKYFIFLLYRFISGLLSSLFVIILYYLLY